MPKYKSVEGNWVPVDESAKLEALRKGVIDGTVPESEYKSALASYKGKQSAQEAKDRELEKENREKREAAHASEFKSRNS